MTPTHGGARDDVSPFRSRVRGIAASRTARGFVTGALTVVLLWALAAHTPLPRLVAWPLVLPDTAGNAEAIVVLGAGVDEACAPDFHSMRRTILASRAFKEGRAPVVLFTGGKPEERTCAISDVRAGLARELGVPAGDILVERTSSTTWENAIEASKVLRPRGVRKVLLVSDSLHLRRGEACMRRVGFEVLRASVPSVDAYYDGIDMLHDALHEHVGWWYYKLRGWI